MENDRYPFVNTPLPYAYDALEPYIDEKTMQLHHDRHLQTYINNLNGILKTAPWLQSRPLEELIRTAGTLPLQLQTPVRNNAGGVYNHRFYFEGMAPSAGTGPQGRLAEVLNQQFGSYDAFSAAFAEAALGVFGSGYAWLVLDRQQLRIVTTANQDTPMGHRRRPILCLDVWEHAYYLKHYNDRAGYIRDWFQVVNWPMAEQRLLRGLWINA